MTDIAVAPGTVAASVKAQLPGLSPGERRIAEVLLVLGPDLIYCTVSDVAAQAGSSISSVVRCCQRLGFKGFQDSKIALGRDPGRPTRTLLADGGEGDPRDVLRQVADAARHAVDAAAGLDPDTFERAVGLLASARRILVAGVGTSATLAQDVAYRLLTIGLPAEAPADVHVQHVRAALLGDGDVCLVVSHTGATRETVATAAAARSAGAQVVAVSSFVRSPLADEVDVLLVAAGAETHLRVEAMASRLAHLVVLDALYVAVALHDEDRAAHSLERTADVLAEHRF